MNAPLRGRLEARTPARRRLRWDREATERLHAAGLARGLGLGAVDLRAQPPDPALLREADAPGYLRAGVLPWRRRGRVTTYAAVDPATLPRALAAISARPGLALAVVCTRADLERAVAEAWPRGLAARAAARVPAPMSLRSLTGLRGRVALAGAAVAAALTLGDPGVWALALGLLFLLNAATGALRIGALLAGRAHAAPAPAHRLPQGALPRVSLLVPLYREAGMIGELVRALSRLDYPRDKLEVRLLLEASDGTTRAAVAAHPLPPWIRPLVVPDGRPRTKPRALNYALDFAQGDIVGILDAEDRPDPQQLRDVAARFAAEPARTACIQCQLAYHNARENWLSRCFQIEYSIWFDVLLRGFRALGLPIPLGGTSVYFRRRALEAVGGWDAHNVTEDADLGMRLARRGYEVAVLSSVTEEEANCIAWRWVRQRSRWLKGYLLTWMSHMRQPRALWRDLGPKGTVALNLIFLGGIAAYLAIPLFWAAVIGWAVLGEGLWQSALPGWAIWPASLSLGLGQAVMLACAALALGRRGQLGLIWCVPTLPLYWTLGALAAWKALIELVLAPFWWDKTAHGLSRQPARP